MMSELRESHNWARSAKELAEKPDRPQARVGLVNGWVEDRWIVVDVLPGSPAEEAGVRRGWVLVTRNDRALGSDADFSVNDGETVTDVYLDEKEQRRAVTMTARALSTVAWRHARVLEDGVVYLRFDEFDRASRRWLSEQLKTHREAPGVIVDLRRNHGGTAFSLAIALGEFFPKQVKWGKFIWRRGMSFQGRSWSWGSARYAGKVAVLVGAQTASSAEIFSRVLQHERRGVIVGRKTAGAVIGSFTYRLPDGGELQLGALDYHDPEGRRLEGVGVTPDVGVEATFDGVAGLRAGRDLDLEAALAALKTSPQR